MMCYPVQFKDSLDHSSNEAIDGSLVWGTVFLKNGLTCGLNFKIQKLQIASVSLLLKE
jgi:hypothetical protein